MSDYISREQAIKVVRGMRRSTGVKEIPYEYAEEEIGYLPSADVRENIPVKFIPVNVDCRGYTETFRCLKCGCDITASYVMKELDYNFCPWCGGNADE